MVALENLLFLLYSTPYGCGKTQSQGMATNAN